MSPIKVTQIISGTNKSIAFEILAEGFLKYGLEISYILIQNSESSFSKFLSSLSIPYCIVPYRNKKDYPSAILRVLKFLKKNKPTIVHTHLREASLIGLSAARVSKIPIRLHTRHHSTSNHLYHPSSVKYDRLINKLSTGVVSISKNVSTILRTYENVPDRKIHRIYHGLDIDKFSTVTINETNQIKAKYKLEKNSSPIVGVISRYEKLKGLQYIIPAFKQFKELNKGAHLVLANSDGLDKDFVTGILKKNLEPNDYTEILFEENLYALYSIFDFLFIPQ